MKLNRERQRRDADGADYFIGRTDHIINCGDENFYLADAEVIRLSHPNIARACAVPVPDEIKGYKRVAVTAAKPRTLVDEIIVKRNVLENGLAYQHQRGIMVLKAVPLAVPGKVDSKQLLESL